MLLKPTEEDIRWWTTHVVPEIVLWWWDDSPIPNETHAMNVLDRSGARQDLVVGDIRYVNAFHTWAMDRDVERIVVDDGSWISSLSEEERRRASELQVRFNRGLCTPLSRFGTEVSIPENAVFNERVVLDQHVWAALPEGSKRAVIESELADWDRDTTYPVPKGTASHIANIANTFVLQDGVNCLAVVACALTGNRDDLHQWMMPDTFGAILNSSGYNEVTESDPQAGDVVIFRDEDGNTVHAAYVIQPDRILNKSGQTSFNPIAILDLASLQGDWSEYTLSVYRR